MTRFFRQPGAGIRPDRHHFPHTAQGFSLPELLLAALIGSALIAAVGSSLNHARRLQQTAEQRLNEQDDFRYAATRLEHDLTQAGSFGCLNSHTGTPDFPPQLAAKYAAANGALLLDAAHNDGFGIRILPPAQLPFAVQAHSNALLLIYAADAAPVLEMQTVSGSLNSLNAQVPPSHYNTLRQTASVGGSLILSNCRRAYLLHTQPHAIDSETPLNLQPAARLPLHDNAPAAQFTLGKLYAAAYLIGTLPQQKHPALLRFDLDAYGRWQGPQLLADDTDGMEILLTYTDGCTAASGGATVFHTGRQTSRPQLPALIQVRLNQNKNGSRITHTVTAATAAPQCYEYREP